jgi:hypothetical protein
MERLIYSLLGKIDPKDKVDLFGENGNNVESIR